MSFQSYRRHVPVPALTGLTASFFGDSISDPFTAVSGTTMGAYATALCSFYGMTRVGAGANANDYTRGAIGGRIMSAQASGVQVVTGEATVVQCCLSYLPGAIFLEMGTNCWFYCNNGAGYTGLTPANIVISWDNLFATLLSTAAVKSIQAVVPAAATTGGSYKLVQGGNTTPLIAHNAAIATINTALSTAAPAAIPYVASIGLLSGAQPVVLTANTAGASGAFTLSTNTVTGGPITIQGGLGGTPAVKLVVVVGTADHTASAPSGGVPGWAANAADCWRQFDGAHQRWHKWHGLNGIPVVYADLRSIPAASLIDGTHPTDPAGTNYYVDRIKRALTMAD